MIQKWSTLGGFLLCFVTANAEADIFEPNLPGGTNYHLVFLSDSKDWAGPGALSYYDTIVNGDAASDSDLRTLQWKVIGSTDITTAKDHTDIQGPVYRIDGRRVADSKNDFWDGSLDNPINVTAGGSRNVDAKVWTGSSTTGGKGSCGTTNGTTACALGRPDFANETVYGDSSARTGSWIVGGEEDLFSNMRYYAISEPILIEVVFDACDVNQDGVCDANDIDAMSQMVIDGTKTSADRNALIVDEMPEGFHTYVGDSTLNGVFDDQDIVKVFIDGKYLTGNEAGWAQGDWDGNFVFDDQDFVASFIAGGYLRPARSATAAVPEPGSCLLFGLGLLGLLGSRRR